MALTCDIIGNDPLFRISGLRYRINTPSEAYKLKLPQSAYSASVVVQRVESDQTLTTLHAGTDYIFETSNRDTESEDLIRAAYPTFSKQLYDSFYIPVVTFGADSSILLMISFQSAFPNILTSAVDQDSNPNGPSVTPELLRQICEDLIFLKGLESNQSIAYSSSDAIPSPLSTDYTGELSDNYIVDESHSINTVEGKVVIRPASGSFYGHEVVVKDKDGATLVQNVDYTICGIDTEATKVCEHESGVYRFIILTVDTNYSGAIYISYHAFGGEVSIENFISLKNQVNTLKDFIDNGSFISIDTLGGVDLIQSILERLKTHDRYYRSLNLSGFRDMSNTFLATPPGGVNDGESHWYRIAYLFKQSTLTDNEYFKVYTRDSVRLKIRLENLGLFFDVFVFANVKTGTLSIASIESNPGNGYSKPNDYSGFSSSTLPEFRIVWRKDNDYSAGAVLQIKLPIVSEDNNETVTIENHNKAGMGGWILRGDSNGTDNVEPEDDLVLLPDKVNSWSSAGASNIYGSVSTYPASKSGSLIWAGSLPLSDFDSNETSLNPCTDSVIDCFSVKSLAVCLFDRLNLCYLYALSDVVSVLNETVTVGVTFNSSDHIYLNLKIAQADGKPTLAVWSSTGTKSNLMKRFDLRQITINAGE